jgi:hypothetical protein
MIMASEDDLNKKESAPVEQNSEVNESSEAANSQDESSDQEEQQNNAEKRSGSKVFYLGEDNSYWNELKKNFIQEYAQLNLEFEILYDINPSKNQAFITKVITERARIVFVDISKFSDVMLHILSHLVRMNAVNPPAVVALTDYSTPQKTLHRAVMTGVSLVHIKSGEFDAVIYSSMCFAFAQAVKSHSFATAKLDDYLAAYVPSKIGLITSMGARIESNLPLNEGSRYNFLNYWVKEQLLAAPNVICANQYQYNIYYNFEYAQELGFEMVGPEDESTNEEQKEKRQLLFTKCRKSMESWINNNLEKSQEKKVKVLVIDKTLSFYESDFRTDEYPYVIHCQPYLKFVKKELLHEFAHLIVFNMEEVSDAELRANEEIEYTYNEKKTLQYILKSIASISDYEPYVIVFNSNEYDSGQLQKMFNYTNIIALKEVMTPDLVIKMAQMLEKKLSQSLEEYDVPLIVLPKRDLKSYAEIEISIQVQALSEQDIYFTSEYEIKPNTVIRIHLHGDIHITVAPSPANSSYPDSYYGLIHLVNETDKAEIRRWINQVFFRQLEEQKQAEREEVIRIKEQAIERKKQEAIEEQRRKEAEAERKRLEEEERQREIEEQREEQERKAQELADKDQEANKEKEEVKAIHSELKNPDVLEDGKPK